MSHSYKSITNQSISRAYVTHSYVYWDNIFTEDELNSISQMSVDDSLSDSRTLQTGLTEYRKSKVNFHHPNDDNIWIFDRLNNLINHVNNEFFNFDLNGYEFYQYSEYREEDSGHYNWHTDVALGGDNLNEFKQGFAGLETRKLSISLLLNEPEVDFSGGDFYVKMDDEGTHVPCKKGRAILFPSYTLHKVSPVTKGVRKSLVVWVTGPKFR